MLGCTVANLDLPLHYVKKVVSWAVESLPFDAPSDQKFEPAKVNKLVAQVKELKGDFSLATAINLFGLIKEASPHKSKRELTKFADLLEELQAARLEESNQALANITVHSPTTNRKRPGQNTDDLIRKYASAEKKPKQACNIFTEEDFAILREMQN